MSYTSLYKAWGETRYTNGTAPTTYRYTGQREEASFGLYYYNARWYDPQLGRFAQPDSIIPEASQGVQAWDRYAYVNNNPLNYTDPSGHFLFASMAIGTVAGAIAGGIIYSAHSSATGGFNWNDCATAATVGAVGGMLIGTGVGAGAGVASIATIGAGAGVLGGQAGYTLTSGVQYNSGDMIIAAGVGGVAGGVTGIVGASCGATASIANIGINGLSSSAEYGLTQLNNGNHVTTFGATTSFITGAATSAFSEAVSPGNSSLDFANEMISRTNNPWIFNSYKVIAKKWARGALTVGGVTQTARTFTENGWINTMNNYLQLKLLREK